MHASISIEPLLSRSPEETRAYGERLGARLQPGDVVALHGDLGAGKTQLVKGICAAWGIDEAVVSSPTFALVQEYAGRSFPVYHFDAYRIQQQSEFFEMGYETYFFGDGVCLVEWPERIASLLPAHTIRLQIDHVDETTRRIAGGGPA
ncbi:MAG: tRNA (adenosine(37)-N6)-threonylcarbamoyltransferase complex ATPase subunit type 1 TsaE [Rhodothermales bacterium]